MQAISKARRLSTSLFQSPIFFHRLLSAAPVAAAGQWPGISHGCLLLRDSTYTMMTFRTPYSSEASTAGDNPTGAVKELYDKMLESVKIKQSMPPNAWLWSLIGSCKNQDDIKLLFDILQNLRRFRLSNLRIHSNFNSNLCREVTKACALAGALDFGKKALWKHNVYGLSPDIGSANHLLAYAKEHNDVELMKEVMVLLNMNDIPLQPGTVDTVFSICYENDKWQLVSKYAEGFIKAGVKLRQTAFDIWMKFAANIGDTQSLWEIEKLRSESKKKHSVMTGIACAKGLLLEHKPEEAAAVIQILNQNLPDAKKSRVAVELQKLVSEWPLEVIKRQKKVDRKALAVSLKTDVVVMINGLLNSGLDVTVNLEDLTSKEGILC